MPYQSLYRKYRSQSFDDLAGQEHVTRTIQNAVKAGKVAHAYLFCGPRGTGKTSTARLLAKALNCEQGPTPNPCNQCVACVGIRDGNFLDLKEIDAASNRGIDDFRDLRDHIAYAPAHGKYVVWVIDEVHQVTPEGFNAFLKTLEEPPPHVVFILATTEVHKIPATIVSRCQRFEFRRASLDQLKERITHVAEREGAKLDAGALDLIAREANGGWRDALSVLEQVLAFSDGAVTAADVYAVLGTVAADTLHALAEGIRDVDGAGVFRTLEDLVSEGKDPRQLLRDLTQYYRTLMLTAAGSAPPGDAEQAARTAAQSRAYGSPRLISAIEVLAHAEREARWSEQPRLLLELAIVRLMHPRELQAAVPRPADAPRPAAQRAPEAPRAAARVERPASVREPPRPAASPFVDEPAPARHVSRSFGGDDLPPPPLTVGDARTGDTGGDEDLLAAFEPRAGGQPEALEPPPAVEKRAVPAVPATPVEAEHAPAPADAAPNLETLARKWRVVREELKRINMRTVEASLVDTEPDRFERDVLVIRFPTKTMAEMFTGRGKTFSQPLEQCIQTVTGIQCRVRAEVGAAGPAGSGAPAPRPQPTPPTRAAGNGKPALDSSRPPAPPPSSPAGGSPDLTHDLVEIFDGQILDKREHGA